MANRRMINKSISVSEQVNDLSDFAALLFTWLIPHTDDYGVIPGTSRKIKALVIPMRKQSAEHVESALKEIQTAGLIWRYVYYDTEYLQFCKFDEHQDLHKRTDPKNPLYMEAKEDSGNFRELPGNSPLIEPKRTKEKGTKPNLLFDKFYKEYPKKKSPADALKAWNKINPDEELFNLIIDAVKKQKTSDDWTKDNGKFIPYPASWLNGKRWLDEQTDNKCSAYKWEELK